MLFATWWLFVMILTAFYTANLTAFLTLSKFTLPIQSVEDIAKRSYQWFTVEGGALEHAIKVDGDLGVLGYSAARGLGHFVDLTSSQTIKDLVSRGWLYLNEKRSLEYFVLEDYINKTSNGVLEKDRCTYVVTQDSYLTRSMSFAYPKHSILPELFNPVGWYEFQYNNPDEIEQKKCELLLLVTPFLPNESTQKVPYSLSERSLMLASDSQGTLENYLTLRTRMLSYVESGIITQLASASLPDVAICPLNLRSKERQLRNSDLLTTYIVIISGFIAAAIAFVCELSCRRWVSPDGTKMSWPLYDILNYNSNNKKINSYPKWKTRFMSISKNNPKAEINGREYFVVSTKDGSKRLIPVRPLSSFLFQYK